MKQRIFFVILCVVLVVFAAYAAVVESGWTRTSNPGIARTNLATHNANNITINTISDARLSANVSLLGQSITEAEIDLSGLPDNEILVNDAGQVATTPRFYPGTFNANQFSGGSTTNIKSGALLTNVALFGDASVAGNLSVGDAISFLYIEHTNGNVLYDPYNGIFYDSEGIPALDLNLHKFYNGWDADGLTNLPASNIPFTTNTAAANSFQTTNNITVPGLDIDGDLIVTGVVIGDGSGLTNLTSVGVAYDNYPGVSTEADHRLKLQYTNGVNAITLINEGGNSRLVITNYDGVQYLDLDNNTVLSPASFTLKVDDAESVPRDVLTASSGLRALHDGNGAVAIDFSDKDAMEFGGLKWLPLQIADGQTLVRSGTDIIGSSSGGSGIGVTNGSGTNITLYTADNDPSANVPALTLRPLESRTTPGGAALLVESIPPYNPAGFRGTYRHVWTVATNTFGDLRPDVVNSLGYNIAGNSSGSSSFGLTDTNEPVWQAQRESRWQNGAGLSQLEWWDYFATPYTDFGTNAGFRFFGANLVWDTTNRTYVSSDANITVDSFHFAVPSVGTTPGNGLPAITFQKANTNSMIQTFIQKSQISFVGNSNKVEVSPFSGDALIFDPIGGSLISWGTNSTAASSGGPYLGGENTYNRGNFRLSALKKISLRLEDYYQYLNGDSDGNFVTFGTYDSFIFKTDTSASGGGTERMRLTATGLTLGKYVSPTNGILWQGGAQLTNIYTATATLDFANAVSIGCSDLTMTVTGAALGDVVDLGVPDASVVANSSYSAWVSAANTVTVRFCALISGDPASGVFRAEVHKWK